MRIAIVSSTLPPEGRGGAEAYVATLAAHLRERHEVVLLSGAPDPGLEGVAHIRLPRLRPVREGDSAAYRLFWHARDQWLPSVHVAMGRALARARPDVVHTHEPQGLSAAVFTATTRARLPHVHTAHDLNLLCARTSMTRGGTFCGGRCLDCQLQRAVRGRAVRGRVDRLIGVSDYIVARHLEASIVSEDRAVTLRPAANAAQPTPRQLERGRVRLGFIGSVAAHKGIRTLIAAMGDAPTCSLTVAGTGTLEDLVRRAARENPRITFLGHVDGAAKEAFFAAIDVLVVPSEWEEPAAMVGFEAAVRGIPVVASDRGGLPELPEVATFRAGDATDLLRAVAAVAGRPEQWLAIRERLLAARDLYGWPRHVADVEAVLERAVSEHARRAS
jgi:glycosyltransferase involved in cell wall biosynthesis